MLAAAQNLTETPQNGAQEIIAPATPAIRLGTLAGPIKGLVPPSTNPPVKKILGNNSAGPTLPPVSVNIAITAINLSQTMGPPQVAPPQTNPPSTNAPQPGSLPLISTLASGNSDNSAASAADSGNDGLPLVTAPSPTSFQTSDPPLQITSAPNSSEAPLASISKVVSGTPAAAPQAPREESGPATTVTPSPAVAAPQSEASPPNLTATINEILAQERTTAVTPENLASPQENQPVFAGKTESASTITGYATPAAMQNGAGDPQVLAEPISPNLTITNLRSSFSPITASGTPGPLSPLSGIEPTTPVEARPPLPAPGSAASWSEPLRPFGLMTEAEVDTNTEFLANPIYAVGASAAEFSSVEAAANVDSLPANDSLSNSMPQAAAPGSADASPDISVSNPPLAQATPNSFGLPANVDSHTPSEPATPLSNPSVDTHAATVPPAAQSDLLQAMPVALLPSLLPQMKPASYGTAEPVPANPFSSHTAETRFVPLNISHISNDVPAGAASAGRPQAAQSLRSSSGPDNAAALSSKTPFSIFFAEPVPATESAASVLPKLILPVLAASDHGPHTLTSATPSADPQPAATQSNARSAAPANPPTAASDANSAVAQPQPHEADSSAPLPAGIPQNAPPPSLAPPSTSVSAASLAIAELGASNTQPGSKPGDFPDTPSGIPTITPPASQEVQSVPAPVQMAQLIARPELSEMRIGLSTTAFGSVEVRTIVHANDVGVLIGSEKGDLRGLLQNDLPAITNTLQEQNLRLHSVNFMQGFAFSNDASGGRDQSQQRSFFSQPAAGNSAASEESDDSHIQPPPTAYSTVPGALSILA